MNPTTHRAIRAAHLALCAAIAGTLTGALSAGRARMLPAALACLAADLGLAALSARLRRPLGR